MQRKLDLEQFIRAIPQNLIQEYITAKSLEVGQEILSGQVDADRFLEFLNDDIGIKGEIHQDITEINDLCGRSMSILMDLANAHRVPIDEKESCEEFAMRVFLRFRKVFNYAHDRFYFLHCSGKVSDHNIACDSIELTEEKKNIFWEKCKAHFAESLMGHNCKVRFHQNTGILMIAIIHGSYKKSVSSWRDDAMGETKVLTYRPAKEDILEFNFVEKRLRIKALNNDKEFYIEAFCKDIICDETQIDHPDRDKTFNLSLLQNDNFRFELNEDVQAVYLREVKVKMRDGTNTEIILKSNDVLHSYKGDFKGSWLTSGLIVNARFLFILKIDGKNKKVSFIITPPNSSDLNRKKYASLVSGYLERIGIKKNDQSSAQRVVEDSGALV